MIRRAVLAAFAAALVLPSSASAADLIALDGDAPVQLAGDQTFDLVYIDTDLRLTGDLVLRADSIYLGPNASILSCFVPPNVQDGCDAPRSLGLVARTSVAVANPISLRVRENVAGPGGRLVLRGASVLLGDTVDVSGRGGAPGGAVEIAATDRLDVQGLFARSGLVTLESPNGVRAGTIRTDAPDNGFPNAGGAVTITATDGDVAVRGGISSRGRGAGGANAGGAGAPITITAGGSVRAAYLDAAGGDSGSADAGAGGPVVVTAGARITVAGDVDVHGGGSGSAGGAAASTARLVAGDSLSVGDVLAYGGQGGAGLAGGSIELVGDTISTGVLVADGASSTAGAGAGQAGGAGGSVVARGTTTVAIGGASVHGGAARSDGGNVGGPGGSVSVTGDVVEVGDVDARGGTSDAQAPGGTSPGAPGGVVRLLGTNGLTLGGRVDAFGTPGAAQGGASAVGAWGGAVTLSGGAGELRIVGAVRATGGNGAGAGGAGGAGAKVTLAGRTMALGAGVVTDGGDGSGNPLGPGGNAGDVVAFTDTEIFNGLIAVFTRGGNSVVATRGLDGQTTRGQGPTGATLTAGKLSFTTAGAPVQGYRILRSLAGTDPERVWQGTTTTGIALPKPPPCVKADYTVVAFQSDLEWVSAPTAPVSVTRAPAAGQRCTAPARVRLATPTVRTTAAALKRSNGQLRFRVVVRGVGKLTVTITRDGRPVATTKTVVVSTGRPLVTVDLPPAARVKGRLGVRLTSVAPVGRATSSGAGTIVVG